MWRDLASIKKSSRQNWVMLQVAEPKTFICNMQDIIKFVVSVTPTGCHLHEPRQKAACVHPFRERQAVEKYLSPHTFLQPYLKLIKSCSPLVLPSLWSSGTAIWPLVGINFTVVPVRVPFSIPGMSSSHPVIPGPQHGTREAGTAFDTSKGLQISGRGWPPLKANLSLGEHKFGGRKGGACAVTCSPSHSSKGVLLK